VIFVLLLLLRVVDAAAVDVVNCRSLNRAPRASIPTTFAGSIAVVVVVAKVSGIDGACSRSMVSECAAEAAAAAAAFAVLGDSAFGAVSLGTPRSRKLELFFAP
jgi:hypothetical protein